MMPSAAERSATPRTVGRYELHDEIASGGMAVVHLGRLIGPAGFSRVVAIKRLRPEFARDPTFVGMFLDEARLVTRIRHPNVATTLDVVTLDGDAFLVMEYVHGEVLSKLIRAALRRGALVPPAIATSIVAGALHGLHAAHEATSRTGSDLHIVHRDVSPQNILVGVDGTPRVLDFGIAKAAMRSQSTRDGYMKGKLGYMSPEQLKSREVDRRTDVFAAGIVLWETLTGRRLFEGDNPANIIHKILEAPIAAPSSAEPRVPAELDAIVMRALERDPARRFQTALEMAIALEQWIALPRHVGQWVEATGREPICERATRLAAMDGLASTLQGTTTLLDPATPARAPEAATRLSPMKTNQAVAPPTTSTGNAALVARALVVLGAGLGILLSVVMIAALGRRYWHTQSSAEPTRSSAFTVAAPESVATETPIAPLAVPIASASVSATIPLPLPLPRATPEAPTRTKKAHDESPFDHR